MQCWKSSLFKLRCCVFSTFFSCLSGFLSTPWRFFCLNNRDQGVAWILLLKCKYHKALPAYLIVLYTAPYSSIHFEISPYLSLACRMLIVHHICEKNGQRNLQRTAPKAAKGRVNSNAFPHSPPAMVKLRKLSQFKNYTMDGRL